MRQACASGGQELEDAAAEGPEHLQAQLQQGALDMTLEEQHLFHQWQASCEAGAGAAAAASGVEQRILDPLPPATDVSSAQGMLMPLDVLHGIDTPSPATPAAASDAGSSPAASRVSTRPAAATQAAATGRAADSEVQKQAPIHYADANEPQQRAAASQVSRAPTPGAIEAENAAAQTGAAATWARSRPLYRRVIGPLPAPATSSSSRDLMSSPLSSTLQHTLLQRAMENRMSDSSTAGSSQRANLEVADDTFYTKFMVRPATRSAGASLNNDV